MGEISELEKWVLETAKDIDKKLCEYTEKVIQDRGNSHPSVVQAQEVRINLIAAITRK
ncbi:MAG: hypothetical protein PHN90_10955 [Methanothrix sp.]|nr:hypothetical protein [Methanothrix sp.]